MMRQIIKSEKRAVRHVGILELDDFYRWLKRWFKFKGYWKSEACESSYAEEIVGPGVKHIRISWKTQKSPTPYVIVNINVNYVMIGVSTKKIPVDGKEVKVYNGDFDIRFELSVERTGQVPPFWRRVYDFVVNKHEIDHLVNEALDDFHEITEETKKIFNQYA